VAKGWKIFGVVQGAGIIALQLTSHSMGGLLANSLGILLMIPGSLVALAIADRFDTFNDLWFVITALLINAGLFAAGLFAGFASLRSRKKSS
jgi:hypothetical protein